MKHLLSGLLLGCAAAVMPGAQAQQDRLDISVPEDALEVQRKFLCSRTEGDVTYGYFEGKMYSRVEGERDRILFNLVGVNVRQCKDLMDPERGKGFRSVSREVMLYLDPETNEVLHLGKPLEWGNCGCHPCGERPREHASSNPCLP